MPPESAEVADIWRTVIREAGGYFSKDSWFVSLSEEDYASVKVNDPCNALEMRKHVRVIPPPAEVPRLPMRGNKALGGAIVDQVTSEKIIVRSPFLLNAIREIVYWPTPAYSPGLTRLELDTPFRSIGVHRNGFAQLEQAMRAELATAVGPARTELQKNLGHLELFLSEADKVQAIHVEAEKERHARGMVTFDMLWMVLKPGAYVYVKVGGFEIAGRIRLLRWERGSLGSGSLEEVFTSLTVYIWYLDHDGVSSVP
jgi:hypothetical protein